MSCAGGWGSSVLTKTKFLGGKYNINLTQKKIKSTDIFPVKPVVFQYQDNSRWHDLWTCFYVLSQQTQTEFCSIIHGGWGHQPNCPVSPVPLYRQMVLTFLDIILNGLFLFLFLRVGSPHRSGLKKCSEVFIDYLKRGRCPFLHWNKKWKRNIFVFCPHSFWDYLKDFKTFSTNTKKKQFLSKIAYKSV